MPAPTLPVAPVPSKDPKKKTETEDEKDKAKPPDVAKAGEGEELVSDQNGRI